MAQPRRLFFSIFSVFGFFWSLYLMTAVGMYLAEDPLLFPPGFFDFKPFKTAKRIDVAIHLLNETIAKMKKRISSLSDITDSQSSLYENNLENFIRYWSEVEQLTSNVKHYFDDSSCHILFMNSCNDDAIDVIDICEGLKFDKVAVKMYIDHKNLTFDKLKDKMKSFSFQINRLQKILNGINEVFEAVRNDCKNNPICVKGIEFMILDSLNAFTTITDDYEDSTIELVKVALLYEDKFVYEVQHIQRMDFEDVINLHLACLREVGEEGVRKMKAIANKRVNYVKMMEAITKNANNLLMKIVPPNFDITSPVPKKTK